MAFKHKGKDNLSVTGFGLASAIASTAMGLFNYLVRPFLQWLSNAIGSNQALFLTTSVLLLLVTTFLTGALIALLYNAFLKTRFASKW